MADKRFFPTPKPLSLAAVCEVLGLDIPDGADPDRFYCGVAPLQEAGPDTVSFLDNRKYVDAFRATKAGVVLVHPSMASDAPDSTLALVTPHPYKSFALIAQRFYPRGQAPSQTFIHGSAVIEPGAKIGAHCSVGANAVVEDGAEIGERTIIAPGVVIEAGVRIGSDCSIGANASISHALIGDRVTIYPGVRIGQDGFGFAMDAGGHVRIPQLGRVIIESDVEVGANSTIDRGAGPDTVIGQGAMIDNLVQIGHNVHVGPGCVIVAQSGVSGSTKLEPFAVLAAQSGIAGHLTIGTGARVGAKAGVMRDVDPGVEVMGYPAVAKRDFFKQIAMLAKLINKKKVES